MSRLRIAAIFCAAIVATGLSACEMQNVQNDLLENESKMTEVDEIMEGMTRDEVIKVLGPYFRSLSPEGFPPVCDTFKDNNVAGDKFIHVWYSGGKVVKASGGKNSVCSIS